MDFTQKFRREIDLINEHLSSVVTGPKGPLAPSALLESMRYSLLNPGKRFRALLSLLTAKTLGHEFALVLPYAAAVELIHTYSLVHDDLPCMDDDDFRRGQPSNHKVFGEAMAVLSGDALQAKAFEIIAENYQQIPRLGLRAVTVLAQASGDQGMVGGQAMDMAIVAGGQANEDIIGQVHKLKTGRLIQAATLGAAVICDANDDELEQFSCFGMCLGLAFQVADDLLDHRENSPEATGYPKHLGIERTKQYLDQLTTDAQLSLSKFGERADDLLAFCDFNRRRVEQ